MLLIPGTLRKKLRSPITKAGNGSCSALREETGPVRARAGALEWVGGGKHSNGTSPSLSLPETTPAAAAMARYHCRELAWSCQTFWTFWAFSAQAAVLWRAGGEAPSPEEAVCHRVIPTALQIPRKKCCISVSTSFSWYAKQWVNHLHLLPGHCRSKILLL